MPDDPALIWETRPSPASRPARPARPAAPAVPVHADVHDRVTLSEAQMRFGVSPGTLGRWARSGLLDAVKEEGRWMVTPASVAARLSQHRGGRPAPAASGRRDAPGPTADGTAMLVPRHAWDKVMDQLGNLHQAGQMLAEARERAARAETEAAFLRERLTEMRRERDLLRRRPPVPEPPTRRWWHALRRPGPPPQEKP